MKLITAILWPDSLDVVHDALDANEAHVVSAVPVVDDHYSVVAYRGLEMRQARLRCRLEIVVFNDLALQDVIDSIRRATADVADDNCLLVVTPVDEVVAVPTH